MIAFANFGAPVALLQAWAAPRGFGGQNWYAAAWQYMAYAHVAFWSPLVLGWTTQLLGSDAMLD